MLRLRTFLHGDAGASLPEYALLLAFIGIVSVAAIGLLGSRISQFFESASTTI